MKTLKTIGRVIVSPFIYVGYLLIAAVGCGMMTWKYVRTGSLLDG